MTRESWTPGQRKEALELYAEHGPAEAARRTGISKGTIASWARRSGVHTEAVANTAAAVAHAALTMAQRKQQLADSLIEDAVKLKAQLWEPCTEQKIVSIAGGLQHAGRWEVATVVRERPTFAEQARIMTAFAIAVDKLQVLTGGVTARVGVEGDREVEAVAAEVYEKLRLVETPRTA